MKKVVSVLTTLFLVLGFVACGNSSEGTTKESNTAESNTTEASTNETETVETFSPSKSIEWVCTSSPGGGSDIYSRTISDIMKKNGIVTETITVNNQTDGGGEVGRRRVGGLKNESHTILTFNTGDLQGMLQNTDLTIENFTPIAIMAVDKHLFYLNKNSKFKTIEEFIEAAKNGEELVIGGSKADDIYVYELFKEKVDLGDNVSYIIHDSSSEALTSLLGEHVDLGLSKPAAAYNYVESGDIIPVAAFSDKRFSAPFDVAPTFEELGYGVIEFATFRGVVGPADMPEETVEFWSDAFKQVSESKEWKSDYIDKFLLNPNFVPYDEAKIYMEKVQEELLNME